MHSSVFSVAGLLALAGVTFAQTAAPVTMNNPDEVLACDFPQREGKVQGEINFTAGKDGKGVKVSIDLTGFPLEGGPFLYHVHTAPVPTDGNCTGTLGHLDPYKVGDAFNCSASKPEDCQVGDLSGKHGLIPVMSYGEHFKTGYDDDYLSINSSDNAYIGGRSITIHLHDKTRIACANITLDQSDDSTEGGNGTETESGNNSTSTTLPIPSGNPSAASAMAPAVGYMTMAVAAAAAAAAFL